MLAILYARRGPRLCQVEMIIVPFLIVRLMLIFPFLIVSLMIILPFLIIGLRLFVVVKGRRRQDT